MDTEQWTAAAMADEADPEAAAVLALEDGALFYGRPFGAVDRLAGGRRGEVVFATSMTGYQEICTDPSYRGQMVVLTYPLIGNYGVTADDAESRRPWLSALLVREHCDEYSNWRASETLSRYLARQGIPAICELDTRALTRHLRAAGTLRGVLRAYPAGFIPNSDERAALVAEARAVHSVSEVEVVSEVSRDHYAAWGEAGVAGETSLAPTPNPLTPFPAREGGTYGGLESAQATGEAGCALTPDTAGTPSPFPTRGDGGQGVRAAPRIVLIDTGFKHNIARCLTERGLQVILAPHRITRQQIRRMRPDGVLLSNGPGDPENVAHLVELTHWLLGKRIPLMGICLGHQILGLAIGASTSRLPFGHHGSNHPVKDVRTGRVTVTAQNHNFQVDAASIPPASGFFVSHVNLSDGSVEGLAHPELPVFSVQYHPEAAPGPQDNRDLFDTFLQIVTQQHVALLAG